MKLEVPPQLASAVPSGMYGRILAATPVVMAVIATMLAGLASSEMTRAQYDRALAAQQQSKAGDQWSFFQAKRLRGAFQRNTAEVLGAVCEVHALDPVALRAAAAGDRELTALLDAPAAAPALGYLQRGELPPIATAPAVEPKIQAALAGLERMKSDAEMAALLAPLTDQALVAQLHAAREQTEALDSATKPVNTLADQIDARLNELASATPGSAPTGGRSVRRDFSAARLRYTALRYETEAKLNQVIANLYELQVRMSNLSAERHHARSQRFFYGMLAAQLGVIVSTFALAARQR
ncbi:MAG: DUF4337 family protein, partial [Phycisphaerae bacterium]